MHERKKGRLKSGKSGKKVKSRKQAIAIGLSEARKSGAKVPRKSATRGQEQEHNPAKEHRREKEYRQDQKIAGLAPATGSSFRSGGIPEDAGKQPIFPFDCNVRSGRPK